MIGKKSVLTYQVTSHQDNYLDHCGVAISTASPTDPNDFTVIFDETAVYGWQTKTIELGEYADRLVDIAFRHYVANRVNIHLKNLVVSNTAR